MSIERRGAPRWSASNTAYKVLVKHEGGGTTEATIVDLSTTGIGLRTNRQCFKAGMRVRLVVDLIGEKIEVEGVVRFVDRFYPRVGFQIDSLGLMEKLVQQAQRGGFMMTEIRGDTLRVNGTVTLVGMKEFATSRHYRKLDLSGVDKITVGAASHVSSLAKKGSKIDCCSEPIAPLFDSLGICEGAVLCTASEPCDLPKKWPSRRSMVNPLEP